jgi:hypothetical protein
MDIAKELATYLSNAGYGTVGTDIFVGQIPKTTDGIYLIRQGGSNNNYLPIEKTYIDIYCKNQSAKTSVETLENIKRYIHRMHNTLFSNFYVFSILALGGVEPVVRDLEYSSINRISLELTSRANNLIS